MYVHNLDPVLFSLGPFAIRWYGLVYALGFLFAFWYLQRKAKEGAIKNLTEKRADDFVVYLIVFSILVSRLTYVFVYNPSYYLANPLEILALWNGGLSFHGGFLGAVLAGIYFQRKYRIKFYQLADVMVMPFAFVLFFGRLANFINAELPGRVTAVSWCVDFGDGLCRHPSQLYEGFKNVIVGFVLLGMQTWQPLATRLKEGTLFWSFVFLYGFGRFLTDFYREPDYAYQVILGISYGQWLSVFMAVLAIGFLWRIHKA